jgi:hypothetical protein
MHDTYLQFPVKSVIILGLFDLKIIDAGVIDIITPGIRYYSPNV